MFGDDCGYKRNKKRCCECIVISVIIASIAFVSGILIGALTGIYASLGIGAFVAILASLGVLLIIRVILDICFRKDKKNENCC